MLVLLATGLPFALFFAWAFEMTPEGLKREHEVDRSQSISPQTGKKLNTAIFAVMALAIAYFAYDKFVLTAGRDVALVDTSTQTTSEKAVTEEVPVQPDKSIAVLPFTNMSSDAEQEYFADGLSEEILNLLAKIPELKVVGRTSSFKFKGQNEDLRLIGEALDVATVLEGSIRKSGSRLRVTAQLISVADGYHMWSETYDRELTDIFEMQDDIASQIMAALKVHIGIGGSPSRGRPADNMPAYEKYLTAKALGMVDFSNGQIELLEEAVALDPDFADAWELLSLMYWFGAGSAIATDEGAAQAFEAAKRALALDPKRSIAAAMKASADIENYSWAHEVDMLEIAIAEHPDHSPAALALNFDYLEGGYLRQALDVMERFARIEPLNAEVQLRVGVSHMGLGHLDQASRYIERAIELDHPIAHNWAFHQHMMAGNIESATESLNALFEHLGKVERVTVDQLRAVQDPTSGRQALAALLPVLETGTAVSGDAFHYYLAFGYIDELFVELNRLSDDSGWSDVDIPLFVVSAMGDPAVIGDPRYVDLMRVTSGIDLWDIRGAPDRCSKESGDWVCK